jgi:membrane-associated phospholipid phosphatase
MRMSTFGGIPYIAMEWHTIFGLQPSEANQMEDLLKRIIQAIRRFFKEKLHYKNEDLPYYLTIIAALILFVAGLNAFVELTEELAEDNLTGFDNNVTAFVLSFRQEWLTQFLIFITTVGTRTGYLIIVALLTAYFVFRHRSWKFIVQTVAVLVLASLSNVALKEVINRARPTIEHLVTVYTLSYPSGHAMSAMGFYGFLIFLTLRYDMNSWIRITLLILLGFLIFSIGLSRIYLGVHYPSDVLAGFIGGLIWVALCAIIFDVADLYRKRKKRMQELLEMRESNAANAQKS